jgi:hypothetical protein
MGCVLPLFVPPATPLPPADRLALIIEGLCQAVARRGGDRRLGLGGLAGPFIILVWLRLRRTAARFAARAARHAALPIPRSSQAVPEAVIASEATQSRRRPNSGSPSPLPRRAAWLLRLVPETAAGASQLHHFLADPEVTALLAAAPRLGRILRPLCHMLGIRPTQALPPPLPPSRPPDMGPSAPPIPCHASKRAELPKVPAAHSAAGMATEGAPIAVPFPATPPSPDTALPVLA